MIKIKLLFVLLFALLIVSAVNAQHSIGIIGGANFSNLDMDFQDTNFKVSKRTVFGFGGTVDFRFSKNLLLNMQLLYLQKGAIAKEAIEEIDFIMKSSFLEVPILLKAEFGNTFKPYVIAGPSLGFLLSSETEAEILGFKFEGDMKDITKSTEYSLVFGIGASYSLGPCSVFLEGRYTYGLTNMAKEGTFELKNGPIVETLSVDDDTDEIKNRGLQILAGISVPFQGR